MLSKIEKKQLLIYVIVAYGVTFLLGLAMWYGFASGEDVSVFPNAQMLYPAAGVMLAYLITRKGDNGIPKRFYLSYLIITLLMVLCAVVSVFADNIQWNLYSQFILIIGSIVCGILMLTEKKEKRAAVGLRWKKGKSSIFCILLFVALYLLRTAISYGLSGQFWVMGEIAKNPTTWILLITILLNFFIVFIAFFGEEYGWRYFLQPLLQKRFGKRAGVILLGVVWGLWHMPVNFFYYTPDNGFYGMVAQQITCITLGIFFAYAYMKTQNIWVPVILHFLNNNLVPIVTGTFSAEVIHNQSVDWAALIPALILNGVLFGGFILAKVFRKDDGHKGETGETTGRNPEVVKLK